MSYKNNLRVIMKTLKICEGNSKGNKNFFNIPAETLFPLNLVIDDRGTIFINLQIIYPFVWSRPRTARPRGKATSASTEISDPRYLGQTVKSLSLPS